MKQHIHYTIITASALVLSGCDIDVKMPKDDESTGKSMDSDGASDAQ